MPIRISRGLHRGLWVAPLWVLAACSPGAPVRSDEPAQPVSPQSALADADSALERGLFPEAARAYREAAQRSEDETVAEQATRAAFDRFQFVEASLAAERWLQLNPTSENARRYAGITALKLHHLDMAEQHFASLLETVYISPAAGFLALAPVISDEAAPADVMELFRRLSARHPDVPEGLYAYGGSALRGDNFAAAGQAAAAAVAKAPYWKPAKMLLARAKIASGKEDEGLALAKGVVTDSEFDIATQLEYAMMLAATGHDDEARAMLTPYTSGKTVLPGALRALGAMELDAGRLDAATGQFENLLATGAQSSEALYFLGVIADRRDDLNRAESYYQRVTSGDYAMAAQQRVAQIKADQSGVQAGVAHLAEVARTQPQLAPVVYVAQAALLSSKGNDRRAGQTYDEAIAKFPDVLDLRMNRIFFLERTGKEDAAIRELRELLDQRPGDAQLQNALGYTLADHDRSLDEARTLITAALAQSPDNAATLDSMGWLLYRQEKYAEALHCLQRSASLAADPEIALHIGEVQWAMGDTAAARTTWRAALERAPGDEKLRKRLERAGP
jgi:tetratricopeptide (TPR) repeat protein